MPMNRHKLWNSSKLNSSGLTANRYNKHLSIVNGFAKKPWLKCTQERQWYELLFTAHQLYCVKRYCFQRRLFVFQCVCLSLRLSACVSACVSVCVCSCSRKKTKNHLREIHVTWRELCVMVRHRND